MIRLRSARIRLAIRLEAFLFISLGLGLLSAPARAKSKFAKVRGRVESEIQSSAADVAVAFRTLDGRHEVLIQPDLSFHAASTMKIPVMIELFQQVHDKNLRLHDELPVKNEFKSIVDGSSYSLTASDDSESDLYKAVGQTRTLAQLCEAMITVSSNLATNLLIEKLGVENIRARVVSLHADGMSLLRGVEDGKAYEKGLNNTTTARGLLVLLRAIAEKKAVDKPSACEMIEILKRQKFHEAIPAGLPPGVVVAHKTGEITKIHHDAAIVYAKKPFILVILVRGIADPKQSSGLMARITTLLYDASQ